MRKTSIVFASIASLIVLSSMFSELSAISHKTFPHRRAYFWSGFDYSTFFSFRDGENKTQETVVTGKGSEEEVGAHFFTTQFYFAYGILNNLNFIMGLDVHISKDSSETEIGLGDGLFGIKFTAFGPYGSFLPGTALKVALHTPLSGYDPEKANAFAEGQTDLEFQLILEYSFSINKFHTSLIFNPGYRLRLTGTPDQFLLGFELGMILSPGIELKLLSDFAYSLEGIDYLSSEYNKLLRKEKKPPFPDLRAVYLDLALETEFIVSSTVILGIKFGHVVYAENAADLLRVGLSVGYLI